MPDFLHNLAGAAFAALVVAIGLHSLFDVQPFKFALVIAVLILVGATVLCLMVKGVADWMSG